MNSMPVDEAARASALLLVFQLGDDRYALEASQVAEVLPLAALTQIPQAPAAVAGLLDYRGVPVPVIDLSQLTLGRPARPRLNTRIVLVHYPDGFGATRLLGLIAERASETLRRDRSDFQVHGVTNGATPYLGPVATDARGLIQWVDAKQLLPQSVRDLLFRHAVETDALCRV